MWRRSPVEPGRFKRRLDVPRSMLDRVALEMAPIQPAHEPLDIGDQSSADLRERRVEDLGVRESLPPEWFLDELVKGVDQMLGHPAHAFSPDPGRAEDFTL